MDHPLDTKISRRSVLAAGPAAALALGALGDLQAADAPDPKGRPKIAALITEFRRNSHAEVIVDRILEGYGWESQHYRPKLELVSMYVDQFPEGDLSRERASRFDNLKIYKTIPQALCLGGDKLAVDGVVIIGEHGDYKRNEKNQTPYPRYEFFTETVNVFRTSGRSVPVFNDKHLSWKWEWAREMVDTAAKLGFPFWAASSVPITWRIPAVDIPLDAEVEEIMAIGNGDPDSYDYHALETMQAMAERRQGAERGVRRLQSLQGDAVWKALAAENWASGGWDPTLFEACLCRSHELVPARAGFNHVYPTPDDMRRMVPNPVAYRFEYVDGLKATMLLLNGVVNDITFAARIKGQPEPISMLSYLGGTGTSQPHNFDALVHYIEQFIRTGQLPHPIERTLLTTGLVCAGVDSLFAGDGKFLDTPQLEIRYQPNHNSTHRQG